MWLIKSINDDKIRGKKCRNSRFNRNWCMASFKKVNIIETFSPLSILRTRWWNLFYWYTKLVMTLVRIASFIVFSYILKRAFNCIVSKDLRQDLISIPFWSMIILSLKNSKHGKIWLNQLQFRAYSTLDIWILFRIRFWNVQAYAKRVCPSSK